MTLVDFADEEGARFGRSLFGSSAVAGTLDPDELADLRDADDRSIAEVLAEHGVDLAGAPRRGGAREGLLAYLELHIEQGPVLDREGVSDGRRDRHVRRRAPPPRLRRSGVARGNHPHGHAPRRRARRRDARRWPSRSSPRRHGGVGTTGVLRLEPGIPTAVPGARRAEVDLRHAEAGPLAAMLDDTLAGRARGGDRSAGSRSATTRIWRIEPIAFDARLVAAAREETATGRVLASGALHDAAEMARQLPVAMMFAPSTGGISHAKEEDTPEADLERADRRPSAAWR